MAEDQRPLELAQLSKLVGWIDEQRKQDKDLIGRISQQGERLAAELREYVGQLIDVQERLRQGQTAVARLPLLDASLRQAREQLTELQRKLQDVEQQGNRGISLQQAEMGRITKGIADLMQQVGELYHRDDDYLSRVQIVAEELKHERNAVAPLPPRIEHVEKLLVSLVSRVQLLEEQRRRDEGLVVSLGQADEELRTEQKRLWQWQQSAEVRWARQLADWTQQVEQWQRLLDEHVRAFIEVGKENAQKREQMQTVQRELAEYRERLGEGLGALGQLGSALEAVREDANRLQQSIEAQRRRVDEQAGLIRELEEMERQGTTEDGSLSRRLDHERARIDELLVAARERDQEQRSDRGELGELHGSVRSLRFQLQDDLERLRQDLTELRHNQRDRLADVVSVMVQQRLRQMTELEQQLRELQEQVSVVDSKSSASVLAEVD